MRRKQRSEPGLSLKVDEIATFLSSVGKWQNDVRVETAGSDRNDCCLSK